MKVVLSLVIYLVALGSSTLAAPKSQSIFTEGNDPILKVCHATFDEVKKHGGQMDEPNPREICFCARERVISGLQFEEMNPNPTAANEQRLTAKFSRLPKRKQETLVNEAMQEAMNFRDRAPASIDECKYKVWN